MLIMTPFVDIKKGFFGGGGAKKHWCAVNDGIFYIFDKDCKKQTESFPVEGEFLRF